MCIDSDYVMRFMFCYMFLQLFMKFGIPKGITTDQGSEYNNKRDSELMTTLLNVDHRLTTPYHPQVIILYIHV